MKPERALRYDAGFENALPDVYHELAAALCRPYLGPGRWVLDVGCWSGALTRLMAHEAAAAVGVDRDSRALQVAALGAPARCWFAAGDIQRLPLRDGRFDAAVLNYVLEHCDSGHDRQVLREIRRVLRPGGRLVILVPRRHWAHAAGDVARWTVGHRHFLEEEIQRLMQEAGFEIERMEARGRMGAVISIPLFYLSKYACGINLYKMPRVKQWLSREYGQPSGFRDLFVVARRPI